MKTGMQATQGNVPVKVSSKSSFADFDRIYDSIARRAYELFEGNGRLFGHDWDNWFRAESEILQPLHTNLSETDSAFTVRAEVPGFTGKDLEINLEPRCLKIVGKRESRKEETKGKMIRSECRADQIARAIELPADVDPIKASATLKDGVLSVELPKAVPSKAVKIEAKAS